MKTNKKKEDIQMLKSKHHLELVMQEAGEVFEVDSENSDRWRSKITPGLTVDIHRQLYEIKKPGMDAETGDVISWLQLRYTWKFSMAIKFLQNRSPDPKREIQPVQDVKIDRKQFYENDFIKKTCIYINPVTGVESYAGSYNYEIMDDLQRRALDIAGDWVIKYFSMSSREVREKLDDYPHRFKKIVDFEIEKCARCETPFNWQDSSTSAWACEELKQLDVISDDENAEYMSTEESIYLDADFVVCEKCGITEYAPRYKALKLVWRSAYRREKAEQEEQSQRERKAWVEVQHERDREEENMSVEAELSVIVRRGGNA